MINAFHPQVMCGACLRVFFTLPLKLVSGRFPTWVGKAAHTPLRADRRARRGGASR